MKRSFKKGTAAALTAALMLSSSMAAFAAEQEGSLTGTGELEGTLSTDVFSVVLPTVSDTDTTFNFILDPEGLISATGAAKYNATFEEGSTLFFANSDGNYSSKSDALTVTNKSTMAVDITLTATVSDVEGISITEDNAFTGDKGASLYLALTDGTATSAVSASGSASLTTSVDSAPAGAYIVQWNSTDSKYEYVLADEANTTFPTYSFQLTGACNPNGDWSGLSAAAPSVNVVWSVAEHVDQIAPSVGKTSYVMTAGQPINVSVDLGSGDLAATGIKSFSYNGRALAANYYTYANGTLTITAATVNYFLNNGISTAQLIVTFNDAASTQVTINLTDHVIEAAPSIDQATYAMTAGQPITVNVDLGAGDLAATDISSFSYNNSVLNSTYYSFENGVLTITSATVDYFLNRGISSAQIIVTFNDTAATQVTITLTN